jgi:hypothetical protein
VINSAISSSSGFTPFELNAGYIPIINLGVHPEPTSVSRVKYFMHKAIHNLIEVHDAIIESRVRQTHQANCWHAQEDTFTAGDLVYVSTSNLSLSKGHTSKLLPKYVDPFKVLDMWPEVSTYSIELPAQLQSCRLHDSFHCSKLCAHFPNNDVLFLRWKAHPYYNFSTSDDQQWLVDEIIAHK